MFHKGTKASGKQCSTEDITLSGRERLMLRGLARGLTKKAIADKHDLSVHTVDNYLRRLFGKLKVNNRSSAIVAGIRAGIIK